MNSILFNKQILTVNKEKLVMKILFHTRGTQNDKIDCHNACGSMVHF